MKRKTILVVDYFALPQKVREQLQAWHLFGNDRMLELTTSYRLCEDPQTPERMLRPANFEELYRKMHQDGTFDGGFDDFLQAFGLRTLYWVACQAPNLHGIDQVVLNVSW